jgi:hypothetical protein
MFMTEPDEVMQRNASNNNMGLYFRWIAWDINNMRHFIFKMPKALSMTFLIDKYA